MRLKSIPILLFSTLITATSVATELWHLENHWTNIHLRTAAQEKEQLRGGEGC